MESLSILRIPYGMTDFVTMRRERYYYVDKTHYIPLLEDQSLFTIFLRPRRFGKSLMLNVLDAYYSVDYASQFDEIFKGLHIGDHPTNLKGKFLVLKFNFSAVNPGFESMQESFNQECLFAVNNFAFRYADYLPADTSDILKNCKEGSEALKIIAEQARRTGQRIYMMIDEYDNFANTLLTNNEDHYRHLTHDDGFFRLFFNQIKEFTTANDAVVQRIFITGVSPLTLSDVTSGFNIGTNLSMDSLFNGMVGFSETEVREMLTYYVTNNPSVDFRIDVEEAIRLMKPWYNNYCFSLRSIDAPRMFNSDMVLYFTRVFAGQGLPPDEMIDMNISTDYGKVRQLVRFENTFGEKSRIMQDLMEKGGTASNIIPQFSIEELRSPESLVSLLFYLGMLSISQIKDGLPILSIPNEVVRQQYYLYLAQCYKQALGINIETYQLGKLMQGMAYYAEWRSYFEFLASQMEQCSSVRDFAQGEAFVKGFFLAYLGARNPFYQIYTEREAAHGYSDLYLEPWNQTPHGYLIELKYCKTETTDEDVCQLAAEARSQLIRYSSDKHYQRQSAEGKWTPHALVIVFRGWKMEICEEVF